MSGWVLLLLLMAMALLPLIWPARLDRGALMLAGAALSVAAAGYSWMGSPDEPGAPAAGRSTKAARPQSLFELEHVRLMGRFGPAGQWLGTADAMNRMGEDAIAAGLMHAATTQYPRDPNVWIGYAHALFLLADGNETPAVKLAYARAQAIDPANPAPRYFHGLMLIEAGDLAGAEREWRALQASLPEGSSWRKPLADRLAGFDAVRAPPAAP